MRHAPVPLKRSPLPRWKNPKRKRRKRRPKGLRKTRARVVPTGEDDERPASNPPAAGGGGLGGSASFPGGQTRRLGPPGVPFLARAMNNLLEQVLEFSRRYFAESKSGPAPPVAGQALGDSKFRFRQISARPGRCLWLGYGRRRRTGLGGVWRTAPRNAGARMNGGSEPKM